jgi:hypothetical protein
LLSSPAEAARALGIGRSTLYLLLANGNIGRGRHRPLVQPDPPPQARHPGGQEHKRRRQASITLISTGWARYTPAKDRMKSYSPKKTTLSLVGKYRKNVRGDTPTAAAIWVVVVSS